MRSLADVIKTLSSNPEIGLSDAEVVRSREQFGKNVLTPLPREPLWKKFIEKFDEPIIKILLAAALLSMVVDLFKPPVEGLRYTLGGIAVGLAGATIAAAFVFKKQQWIPSLLFVSALLLWPIGLATQHASFDG